jgi:hypothetical protein
MIGYTLEQKIGLANLFWLAGAICLFLTVLWITLGNEKSKQTYLKQTL